MKRYFSFPVWKCFAFCLHGHNIQLPGDDWQLLCNTTRNRVGKVLGLARRIIILMYPNSVNSQTNAGKCRVTVLGYCLLLQPRSHYQTFHTIVVLRILQERITRMVRARVNVKHLRLCVKTTAARETHKLILGLLHGWRCTEQWSVNCVP
jgi:hypothetical protein